MTLGLRGYTFAGNVGGVKKERLGTWIPSLLIDGLTCSDETLFVGEGFYAGEFFAFQELEPPPTDQNPSVATPGY